MKLLTYRFFIDLGDAVTAYNNTMTIMTDARNELKVKREQKKDLFSNHGALVSEI